MPTRLVYKYLTGKTRCSREGSLAADVAAFGPLGADGARGHWALEDRDSRGSWRELRAMPNFIGTDMPSI